MVLLCVFANYPMCFYVRLRESLALRPCGIFFAHRFEFCVSLFVTLCVFFRVLVASPGFALGSQELTVISHKLCVILRHSMLAVDAQRLTLAGNERNEEICKTKLIMVEILQRCVRLLLDNYVTQILVRFFPDRFK